MKLLFTLFLSALLCFIVAAQPSVSKIMEGMRTKTATNLARFEINPKDGSPTSALFTSTPNSGLANKKLVKRIIKNRANKCFGICKQDSVER